MTVSTEQVEKKFSPKHPPSWTELERFHKRVIELHAELFRARWGREYDWSVSDTRALDKYLSAGGWTEPKEERTISSKPDGFDQPDKTLFQSPVDKAEARSAEKAAVDKALMEASHPPFPPEGRELVEHRIAPNLLTVVIENFLDHFLLSFTRSSRNTKPSMDIRQSLNT